MRADCWPLGLLAVDSFMKNKDLIFGLIIIILMLAAWGLLFFNHTKAPSGNQAPDIASNLAGAPNRPVSADGQTTMSQIIPASQVTPAAASLSWPLSDAPKRVTKKPFGLKVSPQDSPVSPEKFYGYHTGADFEIFTGEDDDEVPIHAVCSGFLVYKNYVNGYGGVAVERCQLDGASVTVLYGHLKLSSISHKLNDTLESGDQIAILGQGYSQETDGERKHLHLGIHQGPSINLRGYVADRADLADWLDPLKYIK